jgi:hypothetical protein
VGGLLGSIECQGPNHSPIILLLPCLCEGIFIRLPTHLRKPQSVALTGAQLGAILEDAGLPKTGKKADLQDRVRRAGLSPRRCLDVLNNEDLYGILGSLPGAKVGGSKPQPVDRIIDYFDRMVFRDVPAEASPGELYFRYLAELAHRDREVLLANRVIRKDREMDAAFEEGTRYLFAEKLGLELRTMDGSDHCDGCFGIGRRGDILMWDNKSKESVYELPPSHQKQFKRYIRDSPVRVACFLVIALSIGPAAAHAAARLKIESGTDTDVANQGERADVQPGGVQHHRGAGPDGAGGADAVVLVATTEPSHPAMGAGATLLLEVSLA